jgi:hypothetical protein
MFGLGLLKASVGILIPSLTRALRSQDHHAHYPPDDPALTHRPWNTSLPTMIAMSL